MEKPSSGSTLSGMACKGANSNGGGGGGGCGEKGSGKQDGGGAQRNSLKSSVCGGGSSAQRRKDSNGNFRAGDNGRFRECGNGKGDRRAAGPQSARKSNGSGSGAYYDKRPRQRGSSQTQVWDNQMNGHLDADGLVDGRRTGSKKHNLNHLLNFNLTPREPRDPYMEGPVHRRHGKGHKFSKEQFLQANCQFIVEAGKEYGVHEVNPDAPVDWDSVQEIKFNSLSSETTVCPICLHSPVAAKITRCGHIYCVACMLHYLSLSDLKYRKCPICYDAVCAKDLRSVSSVKRLDFKLDDQIHFCLMKRRKGSVIAVPAASEADDELFSVEASLYHKLLIAKPGQVLNKIIDREMNELRTQLAEEGEAPEACFIETALEQLKQREAEIKVNMALKNSLANCESTNSSKLNENSDDNAANKKNITTTLHGNDNDKFNKETDAKSPIDDTVDSKDTNEIEPKVIEHKPLNIQKNGEYYYFYQSVDGQQIYLHPMNVRMLCAEYNCLEQCPQQFSARIVDCEWSSMTEELRKKLRYMQHLPLTCEFRIVEVEMGVPTVSEKTADNFREEVIKRQQKRSKRAREEMKRERHIEVERNKKISGVYPLPRYQLNSVDHFPACNAPTVRSPGVSESSSESDVDGIPHQTLCSNKTPEELDEFPSFARMLKDGNRPDHSPASWAETRPPRTADDGNEENSYSAKPLGRQYSLSDAFEAALNMKSGKKGKKKRGGK